MRIHTLRLYAVLLAVWLTLLSGCGGGRKADVSPSPTATGRLSFSVAWPERAADTRLLPRAANSVRLSLSNAEGLVSEQILARPAEGGTITTTFEGLPLAELTATATAYPNPDGTGTAQAQATTVVAVVPGDNPPLRLTMSSTIERIEISPPPLQIVTGDELTLVATARDASGAVVLLSPQKGQWTSSDTTVATIDAAGRIVAGAVGNVGFTYTDTESGKSAQVTTTVKPKLFIPGYFYATARNGRAILRYNSSGEYVDFFTVPASLAASLNGLAFGPDGKLYVVGYDGEFEYSLLTIDRTGNMQRVPGFAAPSGFMDRSYGKIDIDRSGNVYVGTRKGLIRLAAGDTGPGTLVWKSDDWGVTDVEALPSGNLLIALYGQVFEITAEGTFVRSIREGKGDFIGPNGLEYDPATDSIYVATGGTTLDWGPVFRINSATELIMAKTQFEFGEDMLLTDDGRLIVGSGYMSDQTPGIFDKNLNRLGSFTRHPRIYNITQAPPEP